MKTEDQIQKITEEVTKFYDDNALLNGLYFQGEERDHVINIGTSILCTKWNVGYPGGGFVQAVVNNDLMQSFSKADHINSKAIKFYCSLIYDVSIPF